MPAPPGNTYARNAKNFVKPRKYSPKTLWKKAIEYFDWNEANPLIEEKTFSNGLKVNVPNPRAMSISAFCIHAEISRETFARYERKEEYCDICGRIKDIIWVQKFEGCAANFFNPAIIARELGLKEKIDYTSNGETLQPTYFDLIRARRTIPDDTYEKNQR